VLCLRQLVFTLHFSDKEALNKSHPPSVVVLTGASAGVGRATVLALAHLGCKIGLIARDEEALEETRAELRHSWRGT
jgi:NADP-dependent 3-hydroxy acid dehydrogenase YdfG